MNHHPPADTLERRIGLWGAVFIVIGSTIGSGIFRSPAAIADRVPGPLPLALVWIVGGVVALCGALSLSEVASAFSNTGGIFVFLREGFGRLAAFLFGWAELTVIRAAAAGAISITFAAYLMRVLGYDPSLAPYDEYTRYVAALSIVVVGTVNILGVGWGTRVIALTTIAKFSGLVFIVLIACALGWPRTGGHFTPALPAGSFSASGFGLALASVLWVYDGWADLSFTSGEVKDPARNLPRALIGGTLAVIVIYLLANLAYLAVLPIEAIRRSPLVAADVAERVLGSGGVWLVSLTVMVSTFGTLAASLFAAPRIFFAMADDGLFFRAAARVHPRLKTPHVAIGLNVVLAAAFVLARSFEQLTDAFVSAIVPFYALAVASLFVLRRRSGFAPAFRTPGYPVVPLLFICSALYLLASALVDETSRLATAAVLGVVALGVPVYYVTVGKR